MYGGVDALLQKMENVERGHGVIPGVTAWCEVCKKKSILSYALYCVGHLADGGLAEDGAPLLVYYTRMCLLADEILACE